MFGHPHYSPRRTHPPIPYEHPSTDCHVKTTVEDIQKLLADEFIAKISCGGYPTYANLRGDHLHSHIIDTCIFDDDPVEVVLIADYCQGFWRGCNSVDDSCVGDVINRHDMTA